MATVDKFTHLYVLWLKPGKVSKVLGMDPVSNPYTPGAGTEPDVLVGRDPQLAAFKVLLRRLTSGRAEQSMIVTGLRGVGKTVLLERFRSEAVALHWVVVELEVSKHDDARFRADLGAKLRTALLEVSPRARWTDKARRAAGVLRSFTLTASAEGVVTVGYDAEPLEGFGDHGNLALDLTDVLLGVGDAAQEAGRGIVLLFDELQFLSSEQLEALIAGLHKCSQRRLPITLVGAGLPQIPELAGDAKSYAERLFTFPVIDFLADQDARRALAEPAHLEGVSWADDALDLAVEITGGYPYFIQELGYAVWNRSSGPGITVDDVESALDVYEAKLDSSFFRVRLDRTTDLQRAYLRAMAELGPAPAKAADVAGLLGRASTQVGPTRAELINMGLLFTPQHGFAQFTVPHFDQFMKRAVPILEPPPLRARPRKRGS